MRDSAFYEIYQLPAGHDFCFRGAKEWEQQGVQPSIADYKHCHLAPLEGRELEDIYLMLNTNHPPGYKGRSLSVSDVVGIHRQGSTRYFFCDSMGFNELPDFAGKEQQTIGRHSIEGKMHVLLCYPGMPAIEANIDNGLEPLQGLVGGNIEVCYPHPEDMIGYILNEEGKFLDFCQPNRALTMPDEPEVMYDFIAGPLVVVGLSEENFASLQPDMLQKYGEKLYYPEHILMAGESVLVWGKDITGPNPYESMEPPNAPGLDKGKPLDKDTGGKKPQGDGDRDR